MSKQTIAPLQYVPYIVLYIDGKPFMRYDGPQDEVEIRRFILEVANQIQEKPNFANSVANGKKALPAYTIGQPVCGEQDVCYLEYNEAYHDK
jgi:thioredoxin-like negative regulator of GroEL